MFATTPPLRQSMVQESASRFQRSALENAITKSGFASPATVSAVRTIAPESVTHVPIGSGLPSASRGTLPQIHVVRPPEVMKLRPKAAPNDPGAGNFGTNEGRFLISCLFLLKVARRFRSKSWLWTATALNDSSTPMFDSSPPFTIKLLRPPEGIVAG